MTGEAGQLLVRSGRSRFFLQCLPASDFPDLTAGEFAHRFTLPAAELKRLIDNSQFAISTEETRYYLNGIFFHTVEVRRRDGAARGRDRRPPPGAGRDAGAAGRGRHARRHRAAQGGQRSAEAARGPDPGRRDRDFDRQGALPFRRRRADDQADRRHLPRIRPRHPEPQRQARDGREGARSPRRSIASRRSRRSAAGRSSWRSPTTR